MGLISVGADLANTAGTAVTPGADAFGSWTQLSSSLAADIGGFYIEVAVGSGNNAVVEIGTGAAASETTIAACLQSGRGEPGQRFISRHFVPIAVASGTRIAARAASNSTLAAVRVKLAGVTAEGAAAFPAFSGFEKVGMGATGYDGIPLTAPGSAHTESAYTQLVASTSSEWDGCVVMVNNRGNFTQPGSRALIDVAIGGAGSEVNFVEDWQVGYDAGLDAPLPNSIYVPCSIAAGSRIAARYRAETTTAIVGMAVLGLTGGSGGGSTTVVAGGLLL